MNRLLIFFGCYLLSKDYSAAQVITFNKEFGNVDTLSMWYDGALGVAALSDSTFFVLAISESSQVYWQPLVTYNLDKQGDVQSQKVFGQDSSKYFGGRQGTFIKTKNGEFAVAGNRYTLNNDSRATLWKFSEAGDSLLEKEYGSLNDADTLDNFNDIIQLPDSGFAMVGWSGLNTDSFTQYQWNSDLYVVHTDKEGNLISEKRTNRSSVDIGMHVELFDSSHIIIAAYKKASYGTVDTPWILVTDFDGNIAKERSFPDPPYNCWWLIGPRLFSAIDGNFFFTGCLNGELQTGYYEYPEYIAKIDSDLNFIWETDFNAPTEQYIFNVKQFDDSSIMVVGVQEGLGGDAIGLVMQLNDTGAVVWSKLYKHWNHDFNLLWSIDRNYDCGYVVAGTTGDSDQQAWVLKMDKYGCINPVCDTMPGSCGQVITNPGWLEVNSLVIDMDIFPNPATDQLSILYNLPEGTSMAQLQITNISGQVIYSEPISPSSHTIDLDVSEWASGLYLVSLISAKQQLSEKLLITK